MRQGQKWNREVKVAFLSLVVATVFGEHGAWTLLSKGVFEYVFPYHCFDGGAPALSYFLPGLVACTCWDTILYCALSRNLLFLFLHFFLWVLVSFKSESLTLFSLFFLLFQDPTRSTEFLSVVSTRDT